MDVGYDPGCIQQIYDQLQRRNAFSTGFAEVAEDYQKLLRQCKELKVRNTQLEKEARELRVENAGLQEETERSRQEAVSSERVVAAEGRARELQEELTGSYKEKSRLAEELVAASRQLQIVRDSNEAQARELEEFAAKGRELRTRVKELSDAIEREQSAIALISAELQARLEDKEAAERRAAKLEVEQGDLVKRLLDLQASQHERMNQAHREAEEMLTNARQQARGLLATAAAQQQQQQQQQQQRSGSGPFRSMPSGGLSGMVNGLMDRTRGSGGGGSAGASVSGAVASGPIEAQVPDVPLRAVPAHEGGCYTLAFDRSGARMASAGADKVVRIWEPGSGAQKGALHGMLETVTEVAFTCDAKSLIAAGADQALRLWDLESGRVRHTLQGHSQKVCTVDCSPIDAHRAVSGATDRSIKVWDLGRGVIHLSLPCHSSINAVRCSADGMAVVSGHFDGTLRFWDLRSGKLANEVTGLHTQQITSVAIGLRTGVVLTCGKDDLLKITDARTFQVAGALRSPGFHVGGVWCKACLGADERHAAAGSSDGTLFVWQIDRGNAVVRTLRQDGGQSVMAAAWSPQGTPLVTADKAGLVTFWSPKAEQQPQQQAQQPSSPHHSQTQQHRPQQQHHRAHQPHARHTR